MTTLYCRIGGATIQPTTRVRWGWGTGNRIEDGGTPDTVDEHGDALASDVALAVRDHTEDTEDRNGVRAVYDGHRHLVLWDVDNDAWWLTGVIAWTP